MTGFDKLRASVHFVQGLLREVLHSKLRRPEKELGQDAKEYDSTRSYKDG